MVWKATALVAEMWVETVAEGGRRFMAVWRNEEADAARHCQEKIEAARLGKLLSHREVYRILRSDTHWPSRPVEGILVQGALPDFLFHFFPVRRPRAGLATA